VSIKDVACHDVKMSFNSILVPDSEVIRSEMGNTAGEVGPNIQYPHVVVCNAVQVEYAPLSLNSMEVVAGVLLTVVANHHSLEDGYNCTRIPDDPAG